MAQVGQASDAMALLALNHIFRDPVWSPPDTLYTALCTAMPVNGDTGTTISEAAYTGYARDATTAADWNAASASAKDNSATLAFPISTTGPEIEVAVALVDASSTGTLYAWAMLASSVNVCYGDSANDLIRMPAHGFSNGNTVVFDADTMAGGVALDTEYTVGNATTDTFTLDEASGITSDAVMICGISQWLTVNNNITPQFTANQLTWRLF